MTHLQDHEILAVLVERDISNINENVGKGRWCVCTTLIVLRETSWSARNGV